MPFPACKVFAFALALLGLCITAAPGPALADGRTEEAKEYYNILGWEHKEFSPGFTELRRAWLREPTAQTVAALAELALEGDLDALAFLAVLDRAASGSVRVIPPSFWTDLTLELLGQGEGNYYLAMHYLLHMQAQTPGNQWRVSQVRNAEHFFQSALARHPEGQLGAAITASQRDYYRKFTELPLPIGATDTDKKALELPSSWDPEAQFWLVSASVAGCSEASLQLGAEYLLDREEKNRNVPVADFYFTRCTHDGNPDCAAMIFAESKGGGLLKEDYPRSFIYLVLHARLLEGGVYVTNNLETHRTGYAVHIWGQRYMNGYEEENIPPGSMTQADYDEGVRLSKIYYDEWKAKDDAKKAAREAFYEQTRKQLPEKRAAWEAYQKKK